ncbi:hypothetical protein O3M35_009512 [Rhynocoris fuscipes]|uniref:Uncharacterized protein n=1 Tax=Rhynocoris fuscipes TaxID=488301 RepID=A0AAW1D634_9HEMI
MNPNAQPSKQNFYDNHISSISLSESLIDDDTEQLIHSNVVVLNSKSKLAIKSNHGNISSVKNGFSENGDSEQINCLNGDDSEYLCSHSCPYHLKVRRFNERQLNAS